MGEEEDGEGGAGCAGGDADVDGVVWRAVACKQD